MPFKWKRKTERVPVSPERMKLAVREVVDGSKLRTTAKTYGIDKMTLKRYVERFKRNGESESYQPNYNTAQIFNKEQEKLLGEYLVTSANMNYGLTTKETRELAYSFALANGVSPAAWANKKAASRDWLRGFMARNNSLSLRTPEATSLSRSTAFNKHTVAEFFKLLREVMVRHSFEPSAIYNCDETGVQTSHKPRKIIAKKGQKQVAKVTSAERGTTVTICCAVNATGNSVPPFFIFPRQNVQEYMTVGAPPGSLAVAHASGWMTEENFEKYLTHFIKFAKCSLDNKVLLILDNHKSHMSPNGLEICKNNGIILLTLPPHTSHKLQPLDVSVYGPFKTYFNQESDSFMVNNPGKTINLKNIPTLAGRAHQRAFTPLNITKGFEHTGICPYNPNIFSDADFASASVTDRPNPGIENLELRSKAVNNVPNDPGNGDEDIAGPSTSYRTNIEEATNSTPPRNAVTSLKTPEEVRPYPSASPRKTKGKRKPVKTKILTDTPNMEEIKEDCAIRRKKKMQKPSRKGFSQP